MPGFKNHQIINGLKRCDEKVIARVYRQVYPMIEKFVTENNGTREDAEDLVQDGLLNVYLKIREGKLSLKCKFSTYLYQVCRNIWFNELKKRRYKSLFPDENENYETLISFEASTEERQLNLYQKHFNKLDTSHREILLLHISGAPVSVIMKLKGIRTKQQTFNKIYKCKKELINSIRSDPEYLRLKQEECIAGW